MPLQSSVLVPTTTLENILTEVGGVIDLLKLDCEGCEYDQDEDGHSVLELAAKYKQRGLIRSLVGEGHPGTDYLYCTYQRRCQRRWY